MLRFTGASLLITSCIIVSLTLAVSDSVIAQDTLTVDEQYTKAREAAFDNNNYNQAREIAYQALSKSPDYHGIRIFIANLYAWEKKYPKARQELKYVLEKDTDNRRALLTIIKVESWAGNHQKALTWANQALSSYPQDKEFMLAKASAYQNLENYERARNTYQNILATHSSREARQALETLRLKQMKFKTTISYRHERFQKIFDPWNFLEFQLSKETKYGAVIGRLQYANRFATDGLQVNIDGYPQLFEGLYAYVSGGYSRSSIYPRYRLGFALYKSLPAAFELGAGIRYLDFSPSETTIYNVSIIKYLGNYMFTANSYLIPAVSGSSESLRISVRRYFGKEQAYIDIKGGIGSGSAEIQVAEDIRREDSWNAGISGQYPLNNQVNIGGDLEFTSEDFPNFSRDRFAMKILLSYRF